MLTLPGTPIIYYGDEFGKVNDENYYKEMIKHTGKDDTRFLVRGKIDWDNLKTELNDSESFHSKVNNNIKLMVNTRNHYKCFGRGKIEWVDVDDSKGNKHKEVLAFTRSFHDEKLLIINNLSDKETSLNIKQFEFPDVDVLRQELIFVKNDKLQLNEYGYYWISI